ncbi:hypothetical protein ARMSODRAFT_1005795 [Armillaria solidipes]|uniref:Uncharacterized protein n=1 Tax=Armillaria solidipes TaxID=1076256 RepID=A0A2H3B6X6_9AGAR|nr:hypothetical protein ARMSODRAFT_1005795 [Armillaria solidipes]
MMSWDTEIQQFNTPVRWDALLFGKALQSTLTQNGTFAYFNGRFRYTSSASQDHSSLLLELALAFSTNNDHLTSRALKQNKKRLKKLLAVSDDASEQNKNESGQLENIIKDLTAKHETAVALARNPTSNTTEGRQDDDYLTPVEYGDDLFSNTASTNRKNKADTSLLLSMKWTERSESYGVTLTERVSVGTDEDKVYIVDGMDHVFANILWRPKLALITEASSLQLQVTTPNPLLFPSTSLL